MKQLKIVVLCGGLSTERNISFLTGSRVCAALRRRGHRAVLADLFLGFDEDEGDIDVNGGAAAFDPEKMFADLPPVPEFSFDGQAPDLDAVRRSRKWKSPSLFGKHVLELCGAADIVFIALHGKNGEDGSVQAAFDTLGIPYTGSGHLGAAMAMDKMITKMVVGPRGVRTPAFRRWDYVESDWMPASRTGSAKSGKQDGGVSLSDRARDKFVTSVCRQTSVPCVVKTPDGGSSHRGTGIHLRRPLRTGPALRRDRPQDPLLRLFQQICGGRDRRDLPRPRHA